MLRTKGAKKKKKANGFGRNILGELYRRCVVCTSIYITSCCGKFGSGTFGTCSPWCARLMKYFRG